MYFKKLQFLKSKINVKKIKTFFYTNVFIKSGGRDQTKKRGEPENP